MGLANDFKKLATDLFKTFSDFRDTISIINVNSTSSYDPATGTNTTTGAALVSTGLAFRRNYRQSEINGEVQSGDVEIIVKYDTVNAAVPPNSRLHAGSDKYNIVNISEVPKNDPIVFKFQCRGLEGE